MGFVRKIHAIVFPNGSCEDLLGEFLIEVQEDVAIAGEFGTNNRTAYVDLAGIAVFCKVFGGQSIEMVGRKAFCI